MKKSYKIIIGCIAALFVCIGGFLIAYKTSVSPVSKESTEITISIEENTAPNTVIEDLKEKNVIKNTFFTKLLMKQHHLSNIKAGIYVVDSSWDAQKILSYINDATNAVTDEVLLTIPEGLWSKDIAKRISEISNVSAEECLSLWNDLDFLNEMIAKYQFLDESILKDGTHVKLEGYLYPDSYYIYRDTNARDITLRLLDGFDHVYQSMKNDLETSGMSVHDWVTFASVVQFESGNPKDMPIISSVFHNRFEADMKMESSVTVCYALYDEFDDLMDCETNTTIDSPYNTYLYKGLPIGPVNNPSKEALNAILHPADTEYYYFISDVFGDQSLIPAKTYEEHQANVKKYLY